MSDESRPEQPRAATEPAGGDLSLASDDELAAEGLRALRAEGPSEASRQQLLAGLGLDDGPRPRWLLREPFASVTHGLALGLALGLVLVVLRVLFR